MDFRRLIYVKAVCDDTQAHAQADSCPFSGLFHAHTGSLLRRHSSGHAHSSVHARSAHTHHAAPLQPLHPRPCPHPPRGPLQPLHPRPCPHPPHGPPQPLCPRPCPHPPHGPAPTLVPTPVPAPTARPAPTLVPTPVPAPTARPALPPTSAIVGQLRKNAEEFRYTIGKPGGSLTSATISEPLTLNLAIANDASSSGVLGYLYDGLTETSWLTDQVEPSLAESWDHSDDGLTWTFDLRRDVTWHDGQPFTAQDVDFTFNRIIYNDDIPASSRSSFNFRFLDEESGRWQESPMMVRALDDYTIECVLPVPFAPSSVPWAPLYIRNTSSRSTWTTAPSPRRGTSIRTPPRLSAQAPLPSKATFRARAWSCGATRTTGSRTTRATACLTWTRSFTSSSRTWRPSLPSSWRASRTPMACWARSSHGSSRSRRRETSPYTGGAPLSGRRSWGST